MGMNRRNKEKQRQEAVRKKLMAEREKAASMPKPAPKKASTPKPAPKKASAPKKEVKQSTQKATEAPKKSAWKKQAK